MGKDPAGTINRVEFFRHSLGAEEAAEVAKTLEGVFLTAGPRTKQFEDWLANYLGLDGAVGLFSCTTALFLALKALDIGPGDEVITSPMTFIATSNTILHTGATAVFVDCDPITGNLDLDRVEPTITPRTKAIIPVHLYGHMVDMRRLAELAAGTGSRSSRTAPTASKASVTASSLANLAISPASVSMPRRTWHVARAGRSPARNKALLDRVSRLRTHGMNKEAANRYTSTYQHWDMLELGYKGNMFDIQAALLLPQIPHVDERLAATGRDLLAPMRQRSTRCPE